MTIERLNTISSFEKFIRTCRSVAVNDSEFTLGRRSILPPFPQRFQQVLLAKENFRAKLKAVLSRSPSAAMLCEGLLTPRRDEPRSPLQRGEASQLHVSGDLTVDRGSVRNSHDRCTREHAHTLGRTPYARPATLDGLPLAKRLSEKPCFAVTRLWRVDYGFPDSL